MADSCVVEVASGAAAVVSAAVAVASGVVVVVSGAVVAVSAAAAVASDAVNRYGGCLHVLRITPAWTSLLGCRAGDFCVGQARKAKSRTYDDREMCRKMGKQPW